VKPEFLTADPASHAALRESVSAVVEALTRVAALPGPRSPLDRDAIEALDPCPDEGVPLPRVLEDLRPILDAGIRVSDPGYVAHLHPPPLIAAAAGELAVAVTNQSQDAFDASPAGTYAEDRVVRWLARLHGLGDKGSGVMTMGGTGSNLCSAWRSPATAPASTCAATACPPITAGASSPRTPHTTASAAPPRCSGSA
jgi:hypothetical protein